MNNKTGQSDTALTMNISFRLESAKISFRRRIMPLRVNSVKFRFLKGNQGVGKKKYDRGEAGPAFKPYCYEIRVFQNLFLRHFLRNSG